MNKKYLIIIVLILTIIVVSYSLIRSKKGSPVENTAGNFQNSRNELPLAENVIQSEGVRLSGLTVNYSKDGFTPIEITVKVGVTVTWTNNSDKAMWVASDVHPTHDLYPGFDQLQSVGRDGQYSFIFNRVGAWSYHNHLVPEDSGRVTVIQ